MSFQKGKSPNPKGRPRLTNEEKNERDEIRQILKANVLSVIETLISIATNEQHKDCVKASQVVLERAYGQAIFLDTTDLEDQVINVIVSRAENKQGSLNNDNDDSNWLDNEPDKRTGLTTEQIDALWENAD